MIRMTAMIHTEDFAALQDDQCDSCGRIGTLVGLDGHVDIFHDTAGHIWRVAVIDEQAGAFTGLRQCGECERHEAQGKESTVCPVRARATSDRRLRGGNGHSGASSSQRVEEDSPQWDCHTMGNRICGPQQATQTSVEW